MLLISSTCFVMLTPWNYLFSSLSDSPVCFALYHFIARVTLVSIINICERSSEIYRPYELRLHAIIQLQAALSVPCLVMSFIAVVLLAIWQFKSNVRIQFLRVAYRDIVRRRRTDGVCVDFYDSDDDTHRTLDDKYYSSCTRFLFS